MCFLKPAKHESVSSPVVATMGRKYRDAFRSKQKDHFGQSNNSIGGTSSRNTIGKSFPLASGKLSY